MVSRLPKHIFLSREYGNEQWKITKYPQQDDGDPHERHDTVGCLGIKLLPNRESIYKGQLEFTLLQELLALGIRFILRLARSEGPLVGAVYSVDIIDAARRDIRAGRPSQSAPPKHCCAMIGLSLATLADRHLSIVGDRNFLYGESSPEARCVGRQQGAQQRGQRDQPTGQDQLNSGSVPTTSAPAPLQRKPPRQLFVPGWRVARVAFVISNGR